LACFLQIIKNFQYFKPHILKVNRTDALQSTLFLFDKIKTECTYFCNLMQICASFEKSSVLKRTVAWELPLWNTIYEQACLAGVAALRYGILAKSRSKHCLNIAAIRYFSAAALLQLVLRQRNFRQNFTRKFPGTFGTKVWIFLTKLSRESFVKISP